MNARYQVLKYVAIITLFWVTGCKKKPIPNADYAVEMRQFVIELSAYAKGINPDFLIIPQNGIKLITNNKEKGGTLVPEYLAAIDGQGQEEVFFGYKKDNKETPSSVTSDFIHYLNLLEANNKEVLVTDYCSDLDFIHESFTKNEARQYISFAATERNLSKIPDYAVTTWNENDDDIHTLEEAKNFLYLLDFSANYANKSELLTDLQTTNYDVIIMDRGFNGEHFTAADIASLKVKQNGGQRLVIAYMSIGEAEDYRDYWEDKWSKRKYSPDWLYEENKKWRGNYKVFYWMPEWKSIIYGNENAYLNTLLAIGFDGAYLDIIDAYEFYEEKK